MSKPIYLCDKKKGACKSWETYGWTKCDSIVECNHTSNPEHALCNGCDDVFSEPYAIKCFRCPERKESQDDRK